MYVHSYEELVSKHLNVAIKFSLDQWEAVTLNNESHIQYYFPLSITATIDYVLVMVLLYKHTYLYWNKLLMLKTLR